MPYKVLDIYKDLPQTNCGDCGKGSCFAFASAVYLDAFPLSQCPHLGSDILDAMERKLTEGRDAGEGRRPAANEQALSALLAEMKMVDVASQAERSGAILLDPSEGVVRVQFLDGTYRVSRDDVWAEQGEQPTVWVKIFLLIYLTRATGQAPSGSWVAYRELPNTVSKSKSFEACAEKIAERFGGERGRLAEAAAALGGKNVLFGSADAAYRFSVLPRVDLLLLFWDREEEFPARVSLLLDRNVLEYLDQEAIVFMAEAFMGRLFGEDLSGVIA